MTSYPGTFIGTFLAEQQLKTKKGKLVKSWQASGAAPLILEKIFAGTTFVVNGVQYSPATYTGSCENLAELIRFCKDRHEELVVVSGDTNPWALSTIKQLREFLDEKKPVPAPRRQKVTPVPAPRPPTSPQVPPGRLCLVRIGPSREIALRDYTNMKARPNHAGLFTWDKDHANKIRVGDVLGFILGLGVGAYIEYFHVIEEGTTMERDGNWNVGQPYQAGNGESSVSHRQVIRMKAMTDPKIRLWSELKTQLGYSPDCASWMPRGTMVVSDDRLPRVCALFQ